MDLSPAKGRGNEKELQLTPGGRSYQIIGSPSDGVQVSSRFLSIKWGKVHIMSAEKSLKGSPPFESSPYPPRFFSVSSPLNPAISSFPVLFMDPMSWRVPPRASCLPVKIELQDGNNRIVRCEYGCWPRRGQPSAKNSSCMDCAAFARCASSITKVTLTSEAPSEIMRTGMAWSSSVEKIRVSTR